ncbi:MAG TPA: GNAT family N-acetyltransferase [Steroidobacteraceae bacterium]|nr:GNAT family N-acetyltransferase [Steroidobacteraceae bacterium]
MMLQLTSELDAVDWAGLAGVFERAPLGMRDPDVLESQFRNSQAQCFAYVDAQLIGAGRAISDRVSWTVIFDVVVEPDYQGRGCGRAIVESLVQQAGASNVLLFSVPGKEEFYGAMGFRRLLTAMARFPDHERAADRGYLE